ncbi:putative ATP-dependent DNA helicase [Gordonia araii NBRC 100433]|uniref:DNA 3'-5' helicase n=1 Tax=Gordonia araii NBRC 100433 TaxID=1073574 RepID=G7H2E7_9ACTN|nr:ATP-dependent DNA helicase [Gordonia araii]NNG97560.1 ATP-dependent helicase [Gordonia araii NBRC 100433]GAB10022.1 putative ATP-dependent DNA helicase [Gordonia araii NBRC 100433]
MVRSPAQRPLVRTTLVAARPRADAPRHWPPEVARLIENPVLADRERPWLPHRVHGGPGSGKSSIIVDAAVARLTHPDVDPESVLVLAASRRAGAALREQITRGVLAAGGSPAGAAREPLVRTIHSYAFAILRLQAQAHDNPPPRLITGSEQDVVLRELLAGDVADGAAHWPEVLRPALPTDGFAQALRDLLMRAAERGAGPEELVRLGKRHRRPEWVAAGRMFAQYEQTMLLRGAVGVGAPQASAPAVDAAELVGSALSAFATDPDLLTAQRARIRHVLVDDAQHLDPQAAQLVRLIGTGADSTIIATDVDQSIFGFRGASPQFSDELVDGDAPRDIELVRDYRAAGPINAVGAALAARLPGARPHPYPEPDADASGTATVKVFTSAAKEATAVADVLRRAHLFEDVPWSSMAVIVRSVPRALPALRRAFRSAGVPVVTPASDLPLHRQRAVGAFLVALLAADGADLEAEYVISLLTGPIGGADPAALRRLRRGVRRAAEGETTDSIAALGAAIVDDEEARRYSEVLSEAEARPLNRVRTVVMAARAAIASKRSVEEVLWEAWQASGLERRWAPAALRGGPAGEQSDRDLDAMLALFEAAESFGENLPSAGVTAFVDHVVALQIPRDSRAPSARDGAVTICSAHAAAGREWDVVAVPGVLDGLWPSLRPRGSILATGALVDLLDGLDPEAVDTVARGTVALADERRLLLVACSRARRRLFVSAVEDGSGESAPSRFIPEIAAVLGTGPDDEREPEAVPVDPGVDRVLSLPSLVATLRAEVIAGVGDDETGPTARARAAAELLARLADLDIPGAHPRDWYGLADASTDEPLWQPADGPRRLSPSNIESLTRCSLRWVLEGHGGRDGDATPAVTGTLVHTLVQALAGQIAPDDVTAALRGIWDRVDTGAEWFSQRELERAEQMLDNFRSWLTASRDALDEVGTEVDVDARLGSEDGTGDIPIRLVGRIDRLETDRAGRPVVVDVKTGKNPPSKADAQAHPQLATYQLALHLGGVEGFADGTEPGGGELVYVASPHKTTGAAVRQQPPLTAEQISEWMLILRAAAKASVGPVFTATRNEGCGHCGLHTSCPAQLTGRSVVDD